MVSDLYDDGTDISELTSEGSMVDSDSEFASDFEETSYGPSVDSHDVILPRYMLECTKSDCSWVVCRECY